MNKTKHVKGMANNVTMQQTEIASSNSTPTLTQAQYDQLISLLSSQNQSIMANFAGKDH